VRAAFPELCKKSTLPEKKTYGYRERDEAKRQVFLEQLSAKPPQSVVYIDESGMDSRDDYAYGWNERGQRFHALKSGRRQGRVNMIAALCKQQLMAPFTVEGACNRSVFEIWLENCLLPVLQPGQSIVMDNATFHKGGRIEQLIEQAGCEVWYLPPYSPDLNKIVRWIPKTGQVAKLISRSSKLVSRGACHEADAQET
jgi:transposase